METTEKTFLRRYWSQLALAIVLLILAATCNNNYDLSVSNATLDSIAEDSKLNALAAVVQAEHKEYQRKKIKDSLSKLKQAKQVLQKEHDKLRLEYKNKVAEVARFKTSDVQAYLQQRYNTKNIPVIATGVVINDTVGRKVITDLVIGDGAVAENRVVTLLLKNEQATTEQQSVEISNLEGQRTDLSTAVKLYQTATVIKDKMLSDANNQNVKQKRQTTLWKIISGVFAAVATYQQIAR